MAFKTIGNRKYNVDECKKMGKTKFCQMMKGRVKTDLEELYVTVTGEKEKPTTTTEKKKGKE